MLFFWRNCNAYYAQKVCCELVITCGPDVWSKGHPLSDLRKLYDRRWARRELRAARAELRALLAGDGLSIIEGLMEDHDIALECEFLDDLTIPEPEKPRDEADGGRRGH